MAAVVLKCGIHRVWLDMERSADIENAISRDDIRALVEEGAIRARQVKGLPQKFEQSDPRFYRFLNPLSVHRNVQNHSDGPPFAFCSDSRSALYVNTFTISLRYVALQR